MTNFSLTKKFLSEKGNNIKKYVWFYKWTNYTISTCISLMCCVGYQHNCFLFFYLPYLSSIHEKANCVAIFWTGSPHSLGRYYFRGVWATCLSHKGGASCQVPCPRTQQANLPAYSLQPPINAERQARKLYISFLKCFGMTRHVD